MAKRSRAIRTQKVLFQKQGPFCALCGYWLDRTLTGNRGPLAVSIDHIVPQCKGGTRDIKNLQLVHRCCNETKGGFEPTKELKRECTLAFRKVKGSMRFRSMTVKLKKERKRH